MISKIFFGRIKASTYFFRMKEAKSNRKLWDTVRLMSDNYRSYLSQKLAVDVLKRELLHAEQKVQDIGNSLDDQISKCAFTYTSMENPKIRPEMIINGSDTVTKDIRESILLNCKM